MRLKLHIPVTLTALAALSSGCGEPIGLSFGNLQGSYSFARDGWACSGNVRGSAITAECAIRDEYDGEPLGTATLSATLASDSLDATIRIDVVDKDEDYDGSYCYVTRKISDIVVGARKTADRNVGGTLAALGGSWYANVSWNSQKLSGEAESFDGSACAAASGSLRIEEGFTTRYDANLDIVGSMATGTYVQDGGYARSFSFTASDSDISIGDVRIVRD
jgi:hypothetical protein